MNQSGNNRPIGFGFVFLCVVLAVIAYDRFIAPSPESSPAARPPASAEKNFAEDPGWSKFVQSVQGQIVAAGYECPEIGALWARGERPLGLAFEAVCRPAVGTDTVNTALHYAVYPGSDLVQVCQPVSPFVSCP